MYFSASLPLFLFFFPFSPPIFSVFCQLLKVSLCSHRMVAQHRGLWWKGALCCQLPKVLDGKMCGSVIKPMCE